MFFWRQHYIQMLNFYNCVITIKGVTSSLIHFWIQKQGYGLSDKHDNQSFINASINACPVPGRRCLPVM